MKKSIRSYQREITRLKNIIRDVQWVCPSYNGSDSCSSCRRQRHMGCTPECVIAKLTGDYGICQTCKTPESNPELWNHKLQQYQCAKCWNGR